MDFDDLFSEPVVTPAAPVARKFLPKRKPPAKKASSVATQPSVAEINKQDVVPAFTASNQGNYLSGIRTDASANPAVARVDHSATEMQTLSNHDSRALCDNSSSEQIGSADPVLNTCTTSIHVDGTSNVEQSTREDADISSVVSLDDVRDRSTMVAGAAALTPETSPVEDLASFRYVFSDNNDVLLEIESLDTEDADAFFSQEQVSAKSGPKTHKFHQKPKLCDKGTNVAQSVAHPQGIPMVQSEAQIISRDDQVLERPHERVLISPRSDDTVSIDIPGDCLLNTNQVLERPIGVSQPDGVVSDDMQMGSCFDLADLEGLENLSSQNFHSEGRASTVEEGNGTGNYSSKLRKRKVAQEYVHGTDALSSDAEGSLDCSHDEAIDADENFEGGFQQGETSRKRKPRQKSKESATETKKPARERKKRAEVSDQSDKQPPIRLPHSTRRKRRTVTKSFLDMPDDQIDFETVPIRNLIIRADIKQRQANKRSTAVNPSTPDERGDNAMQDNPYDDYTQDFASDPVRGTDNNPAGSNPDNHEYFNYHTFMDRTPTVRWSMQDTELFYQAVSQFGSDFSMIQQLFPDRTRHQIKLKYKKEERQHPMRLFDALTARAKDLSQFELVIEKLQEQAAQEEMGDREMSQGTQQDGPVDMAGDVGAESYSETNTAAPMEDADFTGTSTDEPAKPEQKEGSIGTDEVQEEYPAEDFDIDDEALRAYTEAYG